MTTKNDVVLACKIQQDKIDFKNELLLEITKTDIQRDLAKLLIQFLTVRVQDNMIKTADKDVIYRKNYFEEENYELEQALHSLIKYIEKYGV